MPFYGDPEHFKLAVKSVINQTNPNWQLVVLDDCYPDKNPGKWLLDIVDPRITYIRNTRNLLPSKNYNLAIDSCTSDFFVIMGCDDILLPIFVERSLQLISESSEDVGIIQPKVVVISDSGDRYLPLVDKVKNLIKPQKGKGLFTVNGEIAYTSLLTGNWTYFPSLIWRKKAIGNKRFRTDLNVVQDLSMILEILEDNYSILIDDVETFCYRRHRKSFSGLTGQDGTKFAEERMLFKNAADTAKKLKWKKATRAANLRLLSRLNACSEVSRTIKYRNKEATVRLLRHIFGP